MADLQLENFFFNLNEKRENDSIIHQKNLNEEGNEDAFYKKNPDKEDYFAIPLTLLNQNSDIKIENSKNIKCIFCNRLAIKPYSCKDCDLLSCKICIEKKKKKY